MTSSSVVRSQTGRGGWQRLYRVTGIAGLAAMALIFIPGVARSGLEPAFGGSATNIVTFFESIHSPMADFGAFVMTVGLIALLWFMVCVSVLLRDVEDEPPWRSSIAAASGLILVALALSANWDAASFRIDDLDPQIARYAFDQGNVAFANGWVALGSFAACSGWVITSTGFVPRWLGWLAVGSGVGLALSRSVWTSEIWLLPYAGFWLWVATMSILLIRRSRSAPSATATSSAPS